MEISRKAYDSVDFSAELELIPTSSRIPFGFPLRGKMTGSVEGIVIGPIDERLLSVEEDHLETDILRDAFIHIWCQCLSNVHHHGAWNGRVRGCNHGLSKKDLISGKLVALPRDNLRVIMAGQNKSPGSFFVVGNNQVPEIFPSIWGVFLELVPFRSPAEVRVKLLNILEERDQKTKVLATHISYLLMLSRIDDSGHHDRSQNPSKPIPIREIAT